MGVTFSLSLSLSLTDESFIGNHVGEEATSSDDDEVGMTNISRAILFTRCCSLQVESASSEIDVSSLSDDQSDQSDRSDSEASMETT